jgi:hypothetical protein
MKKYTVISACALACLTIQAAELQFNGTRYAGYATNAVPAGFSILAVPFSGFNTNSFAITNLSLEALISTNGLAINDRLIAFNEATEDYYYYELRSEGWYSLDVSELGADSTNHVINAPELSTFSKAQGYAFWLKTTNATTAYLQGVVNTNAAGVVVTTNKLTLVGNALPSALVLNSVAFTNDNPWFLSYSPETGPGDEILAVSGTNYARNIFIEGSWKKSPGGTVNADPIPAGSGVWFFRRGDTQTLIVK